MDRLQRRRITPLPRPRRGAGCNFFDTASAYGHGYSEKLLGRLVRDHPGERLYTATKIPPKNLKWPSRPEYRLEDVVPPDHIRARTERSLENLGLPTVDLLQFHVWEDAWGRDEGWQPENCLESLRIGGVDAVQVIYYIFDQAPEDRLVPRCRHLDIGVIARVPFDEGTLTGTRTLETTWRKGDWRNRDFVPKNLEQSVRHAEALRPELPEGMTLPELALRFILANDDVSTTIPGMRRVSHVDANTAASDGNGLPAEQIRALRAHRWDRTPTSWSQ